MKLGLKSIFGMHDKNTQGFDNDTRRSGFTLIELVAVLALLALLAVALITVVAGPRNNVKELGIYNKLTNNFEPAILQTMDAGDTGTNVPWSTELDAANLTSTTAAAFITQLNSILVSGSAGLEFGAAPTLSGTAGFIDDSAYKDQYGNTYYLVVRNSATASTFTVDIVSRGANGVSIGDTPAKLGWFDTDDDLIMTQQINGSDIWGSVGTKGNQNDSVLTNVPSPRGIAGTGSDSTSWTLS